MNILILNWRDIKNPNSGGAEILTHEISKRWVKLGHHVTLFSSSFPNSKKEETVEKVKIIRNGHSDARFLFYSVHFLAFKYYRKNVGKFDAVIDEIHGLPFFTPWYVKEKNIVLICEVAGDLWIKIFGPFFGLLGRVIERIYLQFVYRNIPYLTISDSTKEELIKEGVNGRDITVLPMGLTIPKKINKVEKEKYPTLIFVGRITQSKGIEDAIISLKNILITVTEVKLWIVGNGDKEYINHLKKIAKKFKVSDKITFWGYVSQEKKFELMGKAHLLLAPSMKEGWGLTVPEAARMGTPSVVYNVSGLRDIVKDKVTGIIVKENSPAEITKEVIKILSDKNFYNKLRENARKSSFRCEWDNTAKAALEVIKENK